MPLNLGHELARLFGARRKLFNSDRLLPRNVAHDRKSPDLVYPPTVRELLTETDFFDEFYTPPAAGAAVVRDRYNADFVGAGPSCDLMALGGAAAKERRHCPVLTKTGCAR